jgi:hypothetical protein
MGWQSDWLYQLIFDEVERVWKRARKDGAGRFGPPSTAFLISEMPEADWEHIRCHGDAHRQWTYKGGDPEPAPCVVYDTDLGEQRGMFYERGVVEFFIDTDRKRVLFTYTLGPRYGRGMIFGVVGQGTKGRLTPCAGPAWVS